MLRLHADADDSDMQLSLLAVAMPDASYTTDKAKVTWDAVDLDGLTATRVSGYRVDVSEDGIFWEPIRGGSNTNRADDEGNAFLRIRPTMDAKPGLTAYSRRSPRRWVAGIHAAV